MENAKTVTIIVPDCPWCKTSEGVSWKGREAYYCEKCNRTFERPAKIADLVTCQDCSFVGKHFLMDQDGTVGIATCNAIITMPFSVDAQALKVCRRFTRLGINKK